MYTSGYEFFNDMVRTYGEKLALTIADDYLYTQETNDRRHGLFKKDPEEFQFCKEVWQAMTATKAAMQPERLNS